MKRSLPFWRSNVRADVEDEMQFHLRSAVDEYVAGGMSCEQADAKAREQFGDISAITHTLHSLGQHRERAVNRKEWMQSVVQDARFATRQLWRSPGFATVAILTLALGVGATSAIFSVVNSVLLRPLPYANADRLIDIRERNGPQDQFGMAVTYGNFASWAAQATSFEALGASSGDRARTLTGAGDPISLRVIRASAGYWKVLHIPPAVGRYFTEQEDAPGAEPVVVLSQALWQTAFASDRAIVGRTILLNSIAHRVIGIAPREYAMTQTAAQTPSIWLPLALTPAQLSDHADHELTVVGLIKRGVSAKTALAELTRIQSDLARQYPNSNFDGALVTRSLRDAVVGNTRLILIVLFGAVGLVLLIACANVANLLLARAAARQKEIAIRSALGGGRGRITRQLLVESLVLALTGAAMGLVVAAIGIRVLVRNAPANVPRLQDAHLDGTMVMFTIALALISGVVFGLFPAIRASRPDLRGALGGREGALSIRSGVRAALVVGQVTIALVLLIGSGLLIRSAVRLQNQTPGFAMENRLIASVFLPAARYDTPGTMVTAFNEFDTKVSAMPGVTAAGLISRIPIGARGADCSVRGEGQPVNQTVTANQRIVTGQLFQALGIPIMAGRAFTPADRADSELAVVINHALAQRLFNGQSAVGKRLSSCDGSDTPVWRTIVGVSNDVRADDLASDPPNEVYYPLAQRLEPAMTLVVSASVPVTSLVPGIRRELASVDPLVPLAGVTTMQEVVSRSLATSRFTTLLLTMLGGLGLVLAAIGIYGVVAYFVVQRTREIGVRIALGAKPSRVVALVIGQGLMLVGTGTAVGLVAAWFSAGVLQQMLFEVNPHDPLVFIGVAGALAAIAISACAVPAWRAARIDPLLAMRA